MNTFSSIRVVGFAAGLACLVSCSKTLSPETAAKRIQTQPAAVFSHNDQPQSFNDLRQVDKMGNLPDRARTALVEWIRHSEVKHFSYVYPQYYITLTQKSGKDAVWAICTDAKGKMVGVLAPRGTFPAWNLPYSGNFYLYVCTDSRRDEWSRAILESLDAEGMDRFRLDSRRGAGLTDEKFLISKPAPLATIATAPKEEKAAAPKAAAPEEAPEAPAEEPAEEVTEEEVSEDEFGF